MCRLPNSSMVDFNFLEDSFFMSLHLPEKIDIKDRLEGIGIHADKR